jgi:cyclopropane fatty-acyl-phospholipid synthase-like methyltransferase
MNVLVVGIFVTLGLLAIMLAVFWLVGVWLSVTNVGFVPAPKRIVNKMVRLAGIVADERMIDLGSGDGRIAIAMAGAGAVAEGVELQPVLVWWSKLKAMRMAKSARPHFARKDIWSVDLSDFDVVTSYAFPRMMDRLEEKFDRELKPGARVVLYTFPLPHWQPEFIDGKIYVYRKS